MQILKEFAFFPLSHTNFRCKSFQATKRDEFCGIQGCTVSPGNPTHIRLPYINANVFRQFILYTYTGKVRTEK